MEIIHTDGSDPDFIELCRQLDIYLFEVAGNESDRECYSRFNLLDDIHDALIIYEEGRPVCCGAFKHYEEGVAEIKRVFVHGDCRARGLSKILMKELEQRAQSRGYRTLILETGEKLTAACALYLKIGFRRTENYGQYRGLKESVCMRKEIC